MTTARAVTDSVGRSNSFETMGLTSKQLDISNNKPPEIILTPVRKTVVLGDINAYESHITTALHEFCESKRMGLDTPVKILEDGALMVDIPDGYYVVKKTSKEGWTDVLCKRRGF